MNWLGITVFVILMIGLAVGLRRGAIKIAVSLVASVLTFVIVFFATPYVARGISQLTPIESVVETKINSMLVHMGIEILGDRVEDVFGDTQMIRNILKAAGVTEEKLEEHGITLLDIAQGNVGSEELAEMGVSRNLLDGLKNLMPEEPAKIEIPRETQIQMIQDANIPDLFKKLLLTNNNEEAYEELGATTFFEYISKYLARTVVNVIAFLLTLIVVTIVFRAILFALNIVEDLPVLGIVNRLAGGVLGVCGSLIVVWVLFVIITLLYATGMGEDMFAMIRGNEALSFLYNLNPVMWLATMLRM